MNTLHLCLPCADTIAKYYRVTKTDSLPYRARTACEFCRKRTALGVFQRGDAIRKGQGNEKKERMRHAEKDK